MDLSTLYSKTYFGTNMSHLKVSELFYSIQGEGRFMGVPSVFLRTYGCNFTCGGFGMPKGELSSERDVIAIKAEDYTDYKSLPLVSTGCDSYASWDPRFKHLSPVISTDSIVDSIMDILPHKRWMDEHLVITGGEPLLGWQRAYPDLLSNSKMTSLKEITFETNGTQELSNEFKEYLNKWKMHREKNALTFSVSPKLSISGEKWEEAIRPEVIRQYESVGFVYLKFVVASEEDVAEAEKAVKEFRAGGFRGPVYLMPCGGVESLYNMNAKNVAIAAMNRGWRYSDRLQVPLFKNEWGT
jgi:organic radical activating enzyme